MASCTSISGEVTQQQYLVSSPGNPDQGSFQGKQLTYWKLKLHKINPLHIIQDLGACFIFFCFNADYHTYIPIPYKGLFLRNYTTFTNFSTKYLVLRKVYTDLGGIQYLYLVCQPVRKIIHWLKLVDYLHVQADNPLYNYYLYNIIEKKTTRLHKL